MNWKKGRLIIISGVSGVGKNTILKELFKNKDLNLVYSISMTTRKKRDGEVDKKDYFFVNRNQFNKAIEKKELLEWAEFCGNLYGTPRRFVLDQISKGKNVVLEIEVQGAMDILKIMPEATSIFILPPSIDELKNRLAKRGTESEASIEKRLQQAKYELSFKNNYQHQVINDDLSAAIKKVEEIIKNE